MRQKFFSDKISGMAESTEEKSKAGRPAAPKSTAVKDIRLALKMTQENFARSIGCTTAAVRKAEGKKKLFAEPEYSKALEKLAQEAGVKIEIKESED